MFVCPENYNHFTIDLNHNKHEDDYYTRLNKSIATANPHRVIAMVVQIHTEQISNSYLDDYELPDNNSVVQIFEGS